MKRSGLILLVALLASVGALVAAWGTALERDERTRGFVNPAADADLPYWMPRLGVNADLTLYSPDSIDAQLDAMRAAGVHWLRQFFYWHLIEREQGQFQWDYYDAIMDRLRQRSDIEPIAVLVAAPVWASPDAPSAGNALIVPDNPADFAAFARAFAQRYGDLIDMYQIWDEPNLTTGWGRDPRPVDYAALLRAGYDAIHSADARAQVISAALAPTSETGPQNISDLIYLDDLYRLGLADFSDGIAAKPYGFNFPADDRAFDPASPHELKFARILALREIMLRHGDGRTSLWISEFGWNHLPDDWAGEPSIWGSVSAEQHTRYTLDALALADREWPWLGAMILSEWQPAAPRRENARWGFALRWQGGEPLPLYTALAAAASASLSPESAPPGLHFPANAFARYSGVWTFGELGADFGWLNDSQVAFTFEGTDISLLVREDDYVAYLYATIDGEPANALPRDAAGNAYIVLTSDTRAPELRLVPVARDLAPGAHRLRLIADRGWDRWALAGYAVGAGDPRAPYDRQIIIALATAAIGVSAAAAFARQMDWRRFGRPFARLWTWLGDVGQLALSAAASIILMLGMLLTWTDATPAFFRRDSIQLGLAILSAGLVYINPALVIALLAAALLFLIFFQRPQLGLTLTIFYAPFFLFPVELFRFAFPMSEITILLTAAAWAARGLFTWARTRSAQSSETSPQNSEPRTQNSPLDLALAALLALGLIAFALSTYRAPALTELRTLFIEPALFYVILRTLRPSRADLLRLVDALILAGVAVAAVGLILYVRGDAIITAEEGARRLASVYGSPNNVGLWLGRCLPFALAFALAPLDARRRLASASAMLIMLIALGLTQSAGALFIGLPVGLAVTLIALRGRRGWLPLAGIAGLLAVALPILLQFPRFARLLDPSEGTNFIRLRVWQSAWTAIRDHPVTGLGLDQFLYFFRGRYILPDAWLEPDLSHPHNVIFDVWLRLGIAGVVVFVWLQIAFFRTMLGHLRHLRTLDPLRMALAAGALGAMANLLAHGLVDNSIFVHDLVYVFVLLIGLAATLSAPAENRTSTH